MDTMRGFIIFKLAVIVFFNHNSEAVINVTLTGTTVRHVCKGEAIDFKWTYDDNNPDKNDIDTIQWSKDPSGYLIMERNTTHLDITSSPIDYTGRVERTGDHGSNDIGMRLKTAGSNSDGDEVDDDGKYYVSLIVDKSPGDANDYFVPYRDPQGVQIYVCVGVDDTYPLPSLALTYDEGADKLTCTGPSTLGDTTFAIFDPNNNNIVNSTSNVTIEKNLDPNRPGGTYRCKTYCTLQGYGQAPQGTCLPTDATIFMPGWDNWSNWSSCDSPATQRTRNRTCDNPAPADNGPQNCTGVDTETEICPTPPPPQPGSWGNWDAWSSCSAPATTRTRPRTCNGPQNCPGVDTETEICPTPPPTPPGLETTLSTTTTTKKVTPPPTMANINNNDGATTVQDSVSSGTISTPAVQSTTQGELSTVVSMSSIESTSSSTTPIMPVEASAISMYDLPTIDSVSTFSTSQSSMSQSVTSVTFTDITSQTSDADSTVTESSLSNSNSITEIVSTETNSPDTISDNNTPTSNDVASTSPHSFGVSTVYSEAKATTDAKTSSSSPGEPASTIATDIAACECRSGSSKRSINDDMHCGFSVPTFTPCSKVIPGIPNESFICTCAVLSQGPNDSRRRRSASDRTSSPGFSFNIIDENNFDMVYFRTNNQYCFEVGSFVNGTFERPVVDNDCGSYRITTDWFDVELHVSDTTVLLKLNHGMIERTLVAKHPFKPSLGFVQGPPYVDECSYDCRFSIRNLSIYPAFEKEDDDMAKMDGFCSSPIKGGCLAMVIVFVILYLMNIYVLILICHTFVKRAHEPIARWLKVILAGVVILVPLIGAILVAVYVYKKHCGVKTADTPAQEHSGKYFVFKCPCKYLYQPYEVNKDKERGRVSPCSPTPNKVQPDPSLEVRSAPAKPSTPSLSVTSPVIKPSVTVSTETSQNNHTGTGGGIGRLPPIEKVAEENTVDPDASHKKKKRKSQKTKKKREDSYQDNVNHGDATAYNHKL